MVPRLWRYSSVYLAVILAFLIGRKLWLQPLPNINMGPQAENSPDETHAQFALNNPILVKTLDPALLPQGDSLLAEASSSRRLVFVGDVHGCRDECAFYPSLSPTLSSFASYNMKSKIF